MVILNEIDTPHLSKRLRLYKGKVLCYGVHCEDYEAVTENNLVQVLSRMGLTVS